LRYGVFADVHSNLEAWDVVARALSEEKIDKYVCVGDIVGYGADPGECIDRVRSLDPIVVGGNHDWAAVGKTDTSYFNPYAREAVLWTQEKLEQEKKDYLSSLELLKEIEDFTVVHGTLDEPQEFKYIQDLYSARSSFELLEKSILFVGHSHVPFILAKDEEIEYISSREAKLSSGKKYLVNVGSVGQPRDGNPRACYVIYDTEARMIEIKRLEYDIKGAQAKITEAGLPRRLAERLAFGR